jgi:hypothetical protein
MTMLPSTAYSEAPAPATNGLRHRCRNPRCRMKLSAPVENEHHAFCTRSCYENFHRNRCRVCGRDLRKNGKRGDANRLYCRPPHRCGAEARKWPEKYSFDLRPLPTPLPRTNNVRSAHSAGLRIGIKGDRPPFRCLAHHRWGGDSDRGDHSLYDKDGLTIARVVLEDDGRYHLRLPVTRLRVSWPSLGEARRHAEALALVAVPINLKLAARIRLDNETPHPMGLPLNLRLSQEAATPSDWRPVGDGADVPLTPKFLLRRALVPALMEKTA